MYQDKALANYLTEIGRIPLLTPAEEIQLAHAVQRMLPLRDKEDLTPKERRIVRFGMKAKKRIVEANLRLVVSIAKKWDFGTHLNLMDMVQEGSIGLSRAAEKFDPERGYKFSTYAYWWIRQSMSRALATTDRTIRLPCSASDVIRKAQAFAVEHRCQHGSMPTLDECAKHVKVSSEALSNYMAHASGTASLDAKVNHKSDGQESTVIELIPDHNGRQCEDEMDLQFDLEKLSVAFAALPEYEQTILTRNFALHGGEPVSLGAAGVELGVSRERVRQIKERALRRLRVSIRSVA